MIFDQNFPHLVEKLKRKVQPEHAKIEQGAKLKPNAIKIRNGSYSRHRSREHSAVASRSMYDNINDEILISSSENAVIGEKPRKPLIEASVTNSLQGNLAEPQIRNFELMTVTEEVCGSDIELLGFREQ